MIFIEDQQVKLNGVLLPGVLKSMEIKASARIDEQEVEGSAVKPKQATGYEDAKITIELIVDDTETQTKYQRLTVLRSLFRSSGQAVPQPLSIISEDTATHGINKVLFKELSHKMESKRDQLAVTVELWEYIPQTIKTQKAGIQTGTGGGSASASESRSSKGKREINRTSKMESQGNLPIKKREARQHPYLLKSPAKDTADVTVQTSKIRKRKVSVSQ